jgi:DNA-binding transcriptional MerR regulator
VSIVTIAFEEQRIRNLFERIEEVEDVANSLPEADERRRRLLSMSNATLAEEATIRPVIAARLLGLSEKTIRAWADQGVLAVSQRAPRLLLDVMSVHEVSHLIRELRAVGRDRDLLDEVWHRLNDDTLADRDDFRESLSQMRRGQGRILRPLPEPDADGR